MADVKFESIRSHDGSQNDGFEELTAQLFYLNRPDPNAEWVRKRGSGGDGGVEAYWRLPDNSEICIQSKFFFKLGDSQRNQMTRSVKSMLEAHPNCSRYIFAIPFNLTEGKDKSKKFERDHWNDLKTKWKALAEGRDIKFVLWDATHLNTDLMRDEPEFSGRRKYWFDETFLSLEWFKARIDEAVANLGARYTPEMHVDLPLANRFDAVCRNKKFWELLQDAPSLPERLGKTNALTKMEADVQTHAEAFYREIQRIAESRSFGAALASAKQCAERAEAASIQKNGKDGSPIHKFDDYERSNYFRLRQSALSYGEHLRDIHVDFADAPAIYLTGSAGSGKSHLLADVVMNAVNANLPAVLVLGQQFQSGMPWNFVLQALDINGTADDFLGALDAAGQAHDCRAILAIDALNEGRGNILWPDSLSGFAEKVSRFPNIALVVSCRDTYDRRIRKNVSADQFTTIVHQGFLGHEESAAKAYLDRQGISRQDAPFLDPEFSNPLFLKTICAAIKRKGETHFPKGLRGVTAIFDYYITSVAEAIEVRLNLDPNLDLVRSVIKKLMDEMLDSGLHYIERSRAYEIADQTLPTNGDAERNLIQQLRSEGVLSDDVAYPAEDDNGIDVIRISYERYLDHFRAGRFIEDFVDPQNLNTAFILNGPFYERIGERIYEKAGFLDALTIQIPERFDKELFDLVQLEPSGKWYLLNRVFRKIVGKGEPSPNRITRRLKRYLIDSFAESICWRDPAKTNDDTVRLLNQLLGGFSARSFDVLLRCATDPDHAFNAIFLHRNLIPLDIVKRDGMWTDWIVSQWYDPDEGESSTSVWRLVDWASSVNGADFDDERLFLASVALAWLFSSPNRSLRDRATIALSKLLGENVNVVRQLLLTFDKVNDVYILSRVYAAAYAVSLRAPNNEIARLVRTVINRVFRSGNKYGHVLLQDYVRGIVLLAHRHNQLPRNFALTDIDFSGHSDWPLDSLTPSQVEALQEQVGSVYWSVMSGDFGTYIMNDVFAFSTTPLTEDKMRSVADEWQCLLNDIAETDPSTLALVKAFNGADAEERSQANLKEAFRFLHDGLVGLKKELPDGSEYDEEAHKTAIEAKKVAKENLQSVLSEEQAETWRWLSGQRKTKRGAKFSRRTAKRWIINRVAEMGFVQEDFKKFELRYRGDGGRRPQKSERMGKKYQWIAFHELIASLAANVHYIGRWDGEGSFLGAWQLSQHDIDPSLTSIPIAKKRPSNGFWWQNNLETLDDKLTPKQGAKWVRDLSTLPDNFDGCEAIDPNTSRKVLVLDTFVRARGKHSGYNSNDRQCDQSLSSVIVKKRDLAKFRAQLSEENLAGGFQNPQENSRDAFLLEYPWHPAWNGVSDNFVPLYIGHSESPKCKVHYPYRSYSREDSGYDKSLDRSVSINLPSSMLIDGLDLKLNLDSLAYENPDGDTVFYDPGLPFEGQSSVVVDKEKISSWLRENEYVILTNVTTMKQYSQGQSGTFMGELTDCQLITYDGIKHSGYRWTILTEMGPSDSVVRKIFKI